MNDILKHYKSLPRRSLQAEIREITGDKGFYLWDFIGLGWLYNPASAGKQTALKLGLPEGTVIGYHVNDGCGHVLGSAVTDLMNVETSQFKAPYPDPFA